MSIDWAKNVGTNGNPVSYLHERAVALLYDELKPRRDEGNPPKGAVLRGPHRAEVRVRLPDGSLSHNIREGMVKLKVPGEWDQVGGVVPDLIMYGDDETPIRIIEVIVTSPPTKNKRGKLNSLVKRGVDVVEVVVRNPEDLLTLCWTPVTPGFPPSKLVSGRGARLFATAEYSTPVRCAESLARAIRLSTPKARRELYAVLRELGSLDSLFPVLPDNPKAEILEEERKGE